MISDFRPPTSDLGPPSSGLYPGNQASEASGFKVVKGFFLTAAARAASLDKDGQRPDNIFSRHDIVPRKQPVATANQG